MKLSKNVGVSKKWIESKTREEQNNFIDSCNITDLEKKECKKKLNEFGFRVVKQVKEVKRIERKLSSGKHNIDEQFSKGSEKE